MWSFFLLYTLEACEVRMKELNIFPIKEENYVLPVKEIFSGYNLSYTCTNCPENVYMKNIFYPLNEKENYKYTSISISSNVTHFASLTIQNTLNIYNKDLDLIQTIELPKLAQCFNAIFLVSQQILLDCYVENQLQFQILDQQGLVINQNFSTELPMLTQLTSFLSNGKQTLLYAQYYQKNSIMTLFVQNGTQFYNASVLNHDVVDFSITQKGYIYVLSAHLGICQVIINSQFQFITLTQHETVQSVLKIFSHSSYHLNSQYDTLIVVNEDYDVSIQYFLATQGEIFFMGDFNQVQFDFKNSSNIWIGISDYFLIIQQNNYFTVYSGYVAYSSSQRNISVYFRNRSSTNQIYTYFNPNNNIIYEINDKIRISSVQNPQLTGKFSEKQLEKIKISASEIQLPFINIFCELQINYQIVNDNDSNIYLVYNKKLPLFLLQDSTIQYILDNYSGPLQQINVQVQDSSLASFVDITFQKVNFSFNQNFEITKMFYFDEFQEQGYFFAGVAKNNLLFYFCYPTYCKEFFQTQFEQQIQQIEISFYQLSTIIVAINQGELQFYIFQINYYNDLQFNTIQIFMIEVTSSAFKCFTLMYQNLVVLTQTNKLQIIANNGYMSHEIDERDINKLFETDLSQQITFTPKQIISNQQNQATFIVVNNINSFIILGVSYQNQFIPMSFTKTSVEIQQLNLVNNQLIITYINQNQLCFLVYKLYNLYIPEFQKALQCSNFSNGWNVQSDNIHFYVQTNYNNSILVYSPSQPYHTSMYYKMEGTLFSCINQRSKSFVYVSQNLYQLYTDFLVKFQSSNSEQNSYIQNTQQIVSVSSQLNQSAIVQVNDSLSIINTLTQIDRFTTYSYQIEKLENLTINMNEIVNYQIISYNGYQKQSSPDFQCEFSYFFSPQNNVSCSGYSIVISYQNQIILQNASQLYLPLLTEQNYVNYDFNFTKCIISTIYQNQLYSICENIDFIYLITFNISNNFSFTLIQYLQLPFACENIIKYVQYENLTIILGQNVIANKYHYIYIYNTYNQLNISYYNISCDLGVQDFAFQYLFKDDYQGLVLAFFYICQNQLFYKLGYLNLVNNEFSLDYNSHQIIENGKKFKIFSYTQLLQIVSLEVNMDEILLLVTTTNIVNIFLTMTFSRQFYVKNQLELSGLIQTIPPYGTYNLTYSAVAQNGMLVLLFYNSTERVYAVYNYSNLKYSLDIPLIMIGGISQQLPLPLCVSLTYNQVTKEGQLFDITNGTLYSYQLTQANYLKCQASKAIKSNQYYYIDVANSFSSGTLEFIFEYEEYQSYFWIYLLVIIVLTSIFALIYIFSRKKNEQRQFNLELDFEL